MCSVEDIFDTEGESRILEKLLLVLEWVVLVVNNTNQPQSSVIIGSH